MPDPLLGWRGFDLVFQQGQPCLRSPARGTLWHPGQAMKARCSTVHTPPGNGCSCGIYAAASLGDLREWDYGVGEGTVVALVALAGDVIVGDRGYRAEQAYPVRLYVPHVYWQTARRLREAWGCETRFWDPYTWKE